ncbi:ATP-dependent Clp protease adaptor ClpS [Desulfomonile tiedjei]|uniref:ATP-dependent Clp protease adaptor protein ClpS n=1 Tax=Desulfomonile tiedjei (strain ATCC 49306 / DSM 6799 / DCB-1) TaxID=706587 RepID=I4C6U3_DESTA|nr:ATP-dependent Clp protease adaptor ClpS [Desulfomonile tiedjei]AFM25284.1 ATP-dependent Clp protease adaptor protein ClpS [Desulfomonile tiedjei DSM 6799]
MNNIFEHFVAENPNSPVIHCYTKRGFDPVTKTRNPRDSQTPDEELFEIRIIDNDHNTYREVMDITMIALGVTEEQAFSIAWEVDHLGSCVVAHAHKEDAEELARIIRVIGIEVQVNPIDPRKH